MLPQVCLNYILASRILFYSHDCCLAVEIRYWIPTCLQRILSYDSATLQHSLFITLVCEKNILLTEKYLIVELYSRTCQYLSLLLSYLHFLWLPGIYNFSAQEFHNNWRNCGRIIISSLETFLQQTLLGVVSCGNIRWEYQLFLPQRILSPPTSKFWGS